MLKHKCGTPLVIPANLINVMFMGQLTLEKGLMTISPAQIIGDAVEFEFDNKLYCKNCYKTMNLDDENINVGSCPACKKTVSPKDNMITYGNSILVCHQGCVEEIKKTILAKFDVENYKVTLIQLYLKDI